ncbi:hypothetical protein [Bradyrhizobium sp. SYSU BS000235]|uniref:hypothetical protein n=1 Tax=Bradyrhizobium sp. SYSU BS000235 TaxID=3411332 RepID=UPI003C754E95
MVSPAGNLRRRRRRPGLKADLVDFCADFSKFPLRRAFSDEFLVLPLSRAVLGSHIWVKPAEAPVPRFGLTNISAGRETH